MDINELRANVAVLDEMLTSETLPFKQYSAVKLSEFSSVGSMPVQVFLQTHAAPLCRTQSRPV